MKHFKGVLSAILLVTAIAFVACSNPFGGDSDNSSKYQVGDIVLNDGSYLRGATSVSDEDKENAIAVIYKVRGSTAYGVGLVHSRSEYYWCTSSANADRENITTIQCSVSDIAGNLTFKGDTDGSDNFAQIAAFLTATDGVTDDTGIQANYPAFYFAKNYKDQANSHVTGTAYESGWYLPTIAELYDIWKVKTTVDAASNLCGGSQFDDSFLSPRFWSSSQSDYDDDHAILLDFTDGTCFFALKSHIAHKVFCIRAFN